MRVTYVIDSLAQGGAEQSLVELVAPLTAQGVALDVVTFGSLDDPFVAPARDAGASVRVLEVRGRRGRVEALRADLAQRRPEVVHTTLFEANVVGRVAAARARVPVVSSLVNTPYGADHRAQVASTARLRAAQALDAATCRLVRRFHAPAEEVARVMSRRLMLRRSSIEVIPRARDLERLGAPSPARRAEVRARLGVPPDAALVLAVGRHEPVKNLDLLARALPLVRRSRPDALALVAGREGNATADIEAAITSAGVGDHLRLLGHRDDVADLLAAADVFVLASSREGLPGVVIEAMALGVPVVATDLPGTREALGADLGVLVPVGDHRALATAITRVLAAPGVAGDPDRARARVRERFSPGGVAAATLGLWARAAAAGPVLGRATR